MTGENRPVGVGEQRAGEREQEREGTRGGKERPDSSVARWNGGRRNVPVTTAKERGLGKGCERDAAREREQ